MKTSESVREVGGEQVEYQADGIAVPNHQGTSRLVRSVFENSQRYLKSRNVDIRCRMDAVAWFARDIALDRIVDIGCGDGSISLQLLSPLSHVTLMDISSSMIARARQNVPVNLSDHVELRNEEFSSASLTGQHFDLVISVGVMAHVESPDRFVEKITNLVTENGSVILEFTDAFHPVGWIGRMWGWIKELVRPARYKTNKLSHKDVRAICTRHGLEVVSKYRYARVPLPAFNLLVSHAKEHRLIKMIFGTCAANRNAWLGNEYVLLLRPEKKSK